MTTTGGPFTDVAQQALERANLVALNFNHEYIGTEHLLLGVAEEPAGPVQRLLKSFGVEPGNVRSEIERLISRGSDDVRGDRLPCTPRAKQALRYSLEEAEDLGASRAGPEHILLGLLREQEGVAAQILTNLGIKLKDLRTKVIALENAGQQVNERGEMSALASTVTFPTLRTEIAGIAVGELARTYGTPTFVYDAAKILERVADLQAFDNVRYAQKACSNIAILDLVRRQGVLVDAVSAGEIARAKAAGYSTHGDPPPIVYTADIFDRETLDLVVRENIHANCGSPDMISQLGELAPGREITLRINPGFGHGHSRKTNTGGEQSKHGIWHEQLDECLQLADRFGLAVTGLHLHIGSGTDLAHLSEVCGAMERLALQTGRRLTTLSAGGGLPVPYKAGETYVDIAAYYQLWDATRKKLERAFDHPVRLELEPGRYLVAESGYLVAEVRAVKQMGGNTFYLLDAGFNNLARPVLYGAHHPMAVSPANGFVGNRPMQEVVVGGPLCESGDIFTQAEGGFVCTRALPRAEVGDYLVIENAGAYGFAMGSNYNSKPLAAEVLIHQGRPYLVRQRQTNEDLLRGETLLPG